MNAALILALIIVVELALAYSVGGLLRERASQYPKTKE